MISKLLFDLDGTLTDPKEGICKSAQYALHALGIEEPDIDKLEPFIGPPLMDSFMEFYGMTKERAAEAVVKYRERFSVRGWSENVVYEGVLHMLNSLREAGYVLAVASSKPTVFVERILTHFKLRDAFSVVVGSELDGRRINKDEVIGEALRQLLAGAEGIKRRKEERDAVQENGDGDRYADAEPGDVGHGKASGGSSRNVERENASGGGNRNAECENASDGSIHYDEILMIGDRRFDVEGAHAIGIRCVGVTYGYAQPGELEAAQADFLADSPEELLELLLGLRRKDKAVSGGAERQGGMNAIAGNRAASGKSVEAESQAALTEKLSAESETEGGVHHA